MEGNMCRIYGANKWETESRLLTKFLHFPHRLRNAPTLYIRRISNSSLKGSAEQVELAVSLLRSSLIIVGPVGFSSSTAHLNRYRRVGDPPLRNRVPPPFFSIIELSKKILCFAAISNAKSSVLKSVCLVIEKVILHICLNAFCHV